MSKFARLLLVAVVFAAAACAPNKPVPAAPEVQGRIRFATSGDINVRDIPFYLALDDLREQGYEVVEVNVADPPLVIDILARGDADIGSAGVASVWEAISQGGDLRTIISAGRNLFVLVASNAIQTCADLDGLGIGSTTTRGSLPAMFSAYIEQNCPGVEPQLLVGGNSNSRVAAMASGELDAGLLDLQNWLELDRQAPGRFHIFINFTKDFPDIYVSVFNINKTWGERNPELAKAYVRALLSAQRRILASAQVLEDGVVKHMALDQAAAHDLAAVYVDADIWDPNGGMTSGSVALNLQFLQGIEAVPTDLQAEQLADLSYLNAVLDEIGRQ